MKHLKALFMACLLLSCSSNENPVDWSDDDKYADLNFMTYNLYFGASITDVVLTGNVDEMAAAVHEKYLDIKAVDFNKRGKVIAGIIASNNTDIAVLQEVITYSVQVPGDYLSGNTGLNASSVEYDFLKIILDELAAKGLEYEIWASALNSDEELPAKDDMGETYDVRLTESDVVIAKKGAHVSWQSNDILEYSQKFVFPLFGTDEIRFERSLSGSRITYHGNTIDIYNTHLEIGAFKDVQESQATEAAQHISTAAADMVIMGGDLNSGPHSNSTASYGIIKAVLKDSYAEVNPSASGFTCCQRPDLANPTSVLRSRIDHILYKGSALKPVISKVVGDTPDIFNVYGYWPSDHAGVFTKFRIRKESD